ncbi:phosphoenolpyruvate phosphomutase family protein [Pseudomonas aeruginosa]|nr:phosphoenolpyruvate phosphomutase family protein [Pseudomonas aeruginosa]
MTIIARTNAELIDVDAVIQRTLAYQEAGADGICLVGVRDFATSRRSPSTCTSR